MALLLYSDSREYDSNLKAKEVDWVEVCAAIFDQAVQKHGNKIGRVFVTVLVIDSELLLQTLVQFPDNVSKLERLLEQRVKTQTGRSVRARSITGRSPYAQNPARTYAAVRAQYDTLKVVPFAFHPVVFTCTPCAS